MNNELTKDQLILEALYKGVYYYTRFGEVLHLMTSNANLERITCKYGRKEFYFKYEDFGEKWFLSREVATKKAQEYIEEITKSISLETLKKIVKLKKEDVIFIKDKYGIGEENLYDYHFLYDKTKKAFILTSYDDNFVSGNYYGNGYESDLYLLISDYGKTWALTEEELLNDEQKEKEDE